MLTERLQAKVLHRKHCRKTSGASGVELIYLCPACSRWKLYVNPLKRTFICFKCDIAGVITGDVNELILKARSYRGDTLEVEKLSAEFELPPHAPLSKKASHYIHSRGIRSSSAKKWGICEGTFGEYEGQSDQWNA